MATAQEVMRIVSGCTGFEYGNVRNLGRRLIECETWPVSNGANVADLTPRHVVLLLLALAAGAEAKSAASTGRHYFALPSTDRAATQSTAGEMVEEMLTAFLELSTSGFSKVAYQSQIEVCSTIPAIRIVTDCTDHPLETHFTERGTKTPPWLDEYVRRSCTLPGKVLFDIASDLRKCKPFERKRWAA